MYSSIRLMLSLIAAAALIMPQAARADIGFPIEYLAGEWVSSDYRCTRMHTERVRITVTENFLDAHKIDAGGDRCVPTGNRTFSGNLPVEVVPDKTYPVVFTTGNTVSPACCKSDGYFRFIGTDKFEVCGNAACTVDVLRFRRLNVKSGI